MTTRVTWARREPPLPAAAVAATGESREQLRRATINRLQIGQELQVAGNSSWLVVLGNDLPWAEDAIYLGWDSGILVPTTSAPSPAAGILRDAIQHDSLIVVLPGTLLISKAPTRPADPASLMSGGE